MARQGPLEWILARERLLVLAALIVAVLLAWAYLGLMAGGIHGAMGAMPWTASHAAMMLGMWTIMMVGMMLPAATPMILFFVTFVRRSREQGHQVAPVGAFVAGYVAVWSAFASLATGLQWLMDRAALLSPHMATMSPALGGTVLIAAGLYQWTPLKNACLGVCRSPVAFLTRHWRPGADGAFRMGLQHGAVCVGCCWALMALLFVGGVMNLLWVAAITVAVLVEKLAPRGPWIARALGAALILGGTWILLIKMRV